MEIALLRHGKPDIPSPRKLTASAFQQWVREYDASPLSMSSKPTHEALDRANRCTAIVCSSLLRSINSAEALDTNKIVLRDALFEEAGMPSASWHGLELSPKAWAVFFRVLWLFGYSNHSESHKEARTRALEAITILAALAAEYEKVLLVGHGFFNRMLAKELRRTGWVGPKNPGSTHWSLGVYKG